MDAEKLNLEKEDRSCMLGKNVEEAAKEVLALMDHLSYYSASLVLDQAKRLLEQASYIDKTGTFFRKS
jgi:hypothetical protein